VTERLARSDGGAWERLYEVRLRLYEEKTIRKVFGLSYRDLDAPACEGFVMKLLRLMVAEYRKVQGSAAQGASFAGRRGRRGPAADEEEIHTTRAHQEGEEGEQEADLEVRKGDG
jgi:hypothetical protein